MFVFLFKISVVGLVIYTVSHATAIFTPILLAIVSAFILFPAVRYLEQAPVGGGRKLGVSLAILIAFLLAGLVVFFVVMILFTPLLEEFNKLYKNIPQILTGIQELIVEFENDILLPLIQSGIYDKQSESIGAFLQKAMMSGLTFSFNLVRNVASASVNVIVKSTEFIVVPVLTFYFLKDWHLIMESFLTLFPARWRGKAENILLEMGRVISDFLRGQFLLCVIIGFMMFIGLSAFRMEYPLVLAMFAGIAEAVPIIGPVLSAIPVILIGSLISPYLGLKVTLFCFFIQQVENHIIVPKVMGGSIHLHPVSVIIGILIAGQILGLLGMIIALPAIAMLKVLMKHFWITEENFNDETNDHG